MNWVKSWHFRKIAAVVAFSMLIIGSIPAKSLAYVVESGSAVKAATSRAADMDTVQRVLESKLVAERLTQAGLTAPEIKSRLDKLSDSELHQFASQLNSLYPGGDVGFVIALLVVVILVLVILKLMNKKIIIK